MSRSSVSLVPRSAVGMIVAGLAAVLLGGCSSDVTRFSDPFSNPFASADADRSPTGSVANSAPVGSVQSQPLAPVRSAANPPVRTSSIAPASAVAPLPGTPAGWTVVGGTPIVVAQGETIAGLSQRYGVPAAALLRANGFTVATQVQPGTRLIVPVYHADGSRVAERTEVVADRKVRKAEEGDTERRQEAKSQVADGRSERKKRAKDENLAADDQQDTPAKPAKSKTKTAKADTVDENARKPKAEANAAPSKLAELPKKAVPATPAPSRSAPVGTDNTPTASLPPQTADAKPEFRWPARGRVIQGFKPGVNDGINVALPEGTSVKAAEAGTVIYAGNEVKGYGNMVLIRHPNGYVSAYADNGELEVKRGDQVKRGQIIAKSGQSGNATAPQLHFELRKGSTLVDPAAYLAGL